MSFVVLSQHTIQTHEKQQENRLAFDIFQFSKWDSEYAFIVIKIGFGIQMTCRTLFSLSSRRNDVKKRNE